MQTKYIPDESVKSYGDIDFNFSPHPVSRDVVILKDVLSVKNSLKNLVLLNFYEKPFHPEIGTGVYESLFDLQLDDAGLVVLKAQMISTINLYEPRATDIRIQIDRPDTAPNSLFISIYFVPINSTEHEKLEFFINPVR